jgi:NAD(P)-dependent dehydrogenase (short-subunit alcohol dehydrogenase family)
MRNNQYFSTELEGKTALVTGGTKGIGRAIADKLAEAGARVIITARNQPEETGSQHHFIAADLTQADQVAQLVQQIDAQFGKIDILIDNTGGLTSPPGGFGALTDEHWERELQLNLLAAIRLDKAILPQMIAQKSGVIVHISSIAGRQPIWELNMPYAASKAALNSYSKALASEVASKGVRVLTVSPGGVKTPPMEQFIKDFAVSSGISADDAFTAMMSKIGGVPMGRMAEPEEVASLVQYLVSPSATYLTGANYAIDGGAYPVV